MTHPKYHEGDIFFYDRDIYIVVCYDTAGTYVLEKYSYSGIELIDCVFCKEINKFKRMVHTNYIHFKCNYAHQPNQSTIDFFIRVENNIT